MGIKGSLPIPFIRAASRARGVYWRTMHPLTFGAAIAITDTNNERIALVLHTYGRRDYWRLPGGGIDRAEWNIARNRVLIGQFAQTLPAGLFEGSARREAKEEVGIDTTEFPLIHLLNYVSDELGNRDTLGIFHLPLPGIEVADFYPERLEIEEIRLWDIASIGSIPGASYLAEVARRLQQ